MIVIYSTPTCPRCKLVSAKLHEWGIPHEEKSLIDISAEDMTDCIIDLGCVPMSAPVVRSGYSWYADVSLFPDGKLDEGKLRAIL
jgi:glutaredoxin